MQSPSTQLPRLSPPQKRVNLTQSGRTLDRAHLSPHGVRQMKKTIFLIAWTVIRMDCEWARLYERLVPLKCSYDEKKRTYVGRNRVIGRIAGQIISVIFTLLKKDQEILSKLGPGEEPPQPECYDPQVHHQHREGQYKASLTREKPNKLIQLPPR